MKLEILDQINEVDFRCKSPDGGVFIVDLFVDGKLPSNCVIKRGMFVEIDRMYPYNYIAGNARIIGDGA